MYVYIDVLQKKKYLGKGLPVPCLCFPILCDMQF